MREMTLEEMAMVTGGRGFDDVETIVVTAKPLPTMGSGVNISNVNAFDTQMMKMNDKNKYYCPIIGGDDKIDTNTLKALSQTGGIISQTQVQVGNQTIVTQVEVSPNGNAINWAAVTTGLAGLAGTLVAAATVSPPHVKVVLAGVSKGVGLMGSATGALAALDEKIYGCP
jgi:hypothetical protein